MKRVLSWWFMGGKKMGACDQKVLQFRRGLPNGIFWVCCDWKIFKNCTLAKNFPSFSDQKNPANL